MSAVCGSFSSLASFWGSRPNLWPTHTSPSRTGACCDALMSQQRLLNTQRPGPGIRNSTHGRTAPETVYQPLALHIALAQSCSSEEVLPIAHTFPKSCRTDTIVPDIPVHLDRSYNIGFRPLRCRALSPWLLVVGYRILRNANRPNTRSL